MKNRIIKTLTFILFFAFIYSCNNNNDWETTTFRTENGWGYSISKSKKIYIKQSTIPAVGGMKNFKSEEDALKVGQLVAEKMAKNDSPTITENELKLLNIDIK